MLLLDLLFPKQCISCLKYGSYICNDCVTTITRHNQTCIVCNHISPFGRTHSRCQKHTAFEGCIMPTEYHSLTKQALHKIKYKMNYDILSELLDKTLKSEKIKQCLQQESIEVCTEIPMHKYKFNMRGFNQATLIAKWIEKTYTIKHQSLLRKTRATIPQMSLTREDRLFNIKDVFSINPQAQIKDKRILLVDDVTTTTSTLEEGAKVLKLNGAKTVWGMVVASRR